MKRYVLLFSVATMFAVPAFGQDIPNSHDHPIISRYPGQTIRGYEVKEFELNLVMSVNRTGAPETTQKLAGK